MSPNVPVDHGFAQRVEADGGGVHQCLASTIVRQGNGCVDVVGLTGEQAQHTDRVGAVHWLAQCLVIDLHHRVRTQDRQVVFGGHGGCLVAGGAESEVSGAFVLAAHLFDIGWADQVGETDQVEQLTAARRRAGKNDLRFFIHRWVV